MNIFCRSLYKVFILFLLVIFSSNLVFSFDSGTGVYEDPYLISTCDDLESVSGNLNSYFKLVTNIDCTNYNFEPIGPVFRGNFDGDGWVIFNLIIEKNNLEKLGLFREISDAKIDSVGILNGSVVGGNFVGGLVGRINARSSIVNSYFEGYVSGNNFVGGLIGDSNSRSSISNSYSDSIVVGDSFVGGLIGSLSGLSIIVDSYSLGSVDGENFIGGLVGSNLLAGVYNSFSDINVSGVKSVGNFVGVNLIAAISDSYVNSHDGTVPRFSGKGGFFIDVEKILDDSEYFFSDLNHPLSNWDTEDWSFLIDDYPGLGEFFVSNGEIDLLAPETQFYYAELQNSLLMYMDSKDNVGGSGLNHFNYCIDESNTCDPFSSEDFLDGLRFEVTCLSAWTCDKYVRYSSIDNAGNLEQIKSEKFKIYGVGNVCMETCISKPLPGRYLRSCNHLNSCEFYSYNDEGEFDGGDYVSVMCDFALEGSFVFFNSTHDIMCPNGPFRQTIFTHEIIEIKESVCLNLVSSEYPTLIDGQSVLMKILTCVD